MNGHVSLTDNGAQRPNRIWIDYGPSPYVVCVFQPYKPNRRLPRLTIPDGATDRVEIWGGADAREDAREEASQTRKTTDFMSIHMCILVKEHLVTRLSVRQACDEVSHGRCWQEQSCLLTQLLRAEALQLGYRGVVAIHVCAQFGITHSIAHPVCRLRHDVAPQIYWSITHLLGSLPRNETMRVRSSSSTLQSAPSSACGSSSRPTRRAADDASSADLVWKTPGAPLNGSVADTYSLSAGSVLH